METNVNYTVVGAFVILLVTFFITAIIWLSSGFDFELFNNYMVMMNESVSGLSIDSPVEFNGVDVGSVKSIVINKENPDLVELLVSIKSSTPISMATVATLKSKGVTGVTYVALKDNGEDRRPLLVTKGHKYPIIKTIPSLLVRLDMAITRLSVNLQRVTESIQSVLDEENQRSIKATLANMNRITSVIVANDKRIAQILDNTAKASKNFAAFTRSGTDAAVILETQLLPKSYELLANFSNMSRTIADVAASVKQNPSILVRGEAPKPLGPGETK